MADQPPKTLNPWIPETDPIRLAVLGKLLEELAEAGSIAARCVIQGIDDCEPVTKVPNRTAFEDELADVYAVITMACNQFKLDPQRILERQIRKMEHLTAWHALIRERLAQDRDSASPRSILEKEGTGTAR